MPFAGCPVKMCSRDRSMVARIRLWLVDILPDHTSHSKGTANALSNGVLLYNTSYVFADGACILV